MPELQVPRLEDGLKRVHGTAVFVPFERREEEVEDVRVEPCDRVLHLRGWVEDQVQRVLREDIGDLGDGFAEFRGRLGVVGNRLGKRW